jgi:hypothetical protein
VNLSTRARLSLALQRTTGHVLAVLWVPFAAFLLRVVLGYRVRDARDLRRRYRQLLREADSPVLICANHLTMIDSALVAWALGGSWWYVRNYRWMPWNLPERANFAHNLVSRMAAWMVKCIPITRGGPRDLVAVALRKVGYVLTRGETALVFPEGGRSRSGRVEPDDVTYGVGRILNAVPGCRTVCVYLRGDRQLGWSTVPPRGDRFTVDFEVVQPETEVEGSALRRARDLARQIGERLAHMEREYFARRTGTGPGDVVPAG